MTKNNKTTNKKITNAKIKNPKTTNTVKKLFSNSQFKNGNYSAILIAVVIAIVVIINMLVHQLPGSITNLDMSDTLIYSVGDTTKDMLSKLQRDVTVKVIAESGNVDSRIETFLQNYADSSSHIKVEYVDPVLHPSVLTDYDVSEYSIIVECADTGRTKTIGFGDIIVYDQSSYYQTGTVKEQEFDGEGQLTSAIDYVTSDSLKKVYTLSGHGESEFSSAVQDLTNKANLEISSWNILTDGAIPEDCNLLILYAPTKDLSNDEKTALTDYINSGKNLMILPTVTSEPLENLTSLIRDYGLELTNTYVGDEERYYQAMGSPYNFFPTLTSSAVNIASDAMLFVSAVGGMTQVAEPASDLSIEPFMTTSEKGFVLDTETQDKKTDSEGTYLLGATVTKTIDENTSGKLMVLTASTLIHESITSSFKNLDNLSEFTNMLTWYFDDTENISIPAKSLEIPYNTFVAVGGWSFLFIGVIPLAALVGGFVVWLKRRKA